MVSIERMDYPTDRLREFGYSGDRPGIFLWHEGEPTVQLQMRLGACTKEPWTVAMIEQMPVELAFWDVGANSGPYSLLASKLGRLVVAVEPATPNYAALLRNLWINHGLDGKPLTERVLTIHAGLGDKTRLDWLNLASALPHSAGHQIGNLPGNVPLKFHREVVPVWTMDELVGRFGLPAPGVVKIDVDGHEHQVLAGAKESLRQHCQMMMLEMPLQQETALVAELKELGLELVERFDHRGGQKISNICYGRFERR